MNRKVRGNNDVLRLKHLLRNVSGKLRLAFLQPVAPEDAPDIRLNIRMNSSLSRIPRLNDIVRRVFQAFLAYRLVPLGIPIPQPVPKIREQHIARESRRALQRACDPVPRTLHDQCVKIFITPHDLFQEGLHLACSLLGCRPRRRLGVSR